jgi:hypothetical protein
VSAGNEQAGLESRRGSDDDAQYEQRCAGPTRREARKCSLQVTCPVLIHQCPGWSIQSAPLAGDPPAGYPSIPLSRDVCIVAWGGLEVDDAAANTDGDGLCTIFRAELVHDVFDVDLHGLFRDRQALANVPIAVALGNPLQDLNLALGQ